MTHSQSGMCDLCGDDHEACNCPMLSQLDLLTKQVEDRESQFAFQSLPSWVQVEDYCQRLRLVVANHSLPKFTKLGPLIAPHTPNLDPATTFPLKICHMGGGHTYLDLSRKWLCNWLSLIPPGSPSNKNLMACQIEDLIYYVASKEIEEGSELRVWYAPFYQHKVKDELKALGYNQSLVGTSVLTRRVPFEQSQAKTPAETYLHVAPSLTRIIVGKDQITFTHSAIQGEREHDNNFIKHPLVPNAHPVADKYFSSEIELEKQITTTVSSSGNYLCEKNIQQKKKDETANEGNFEFCPQVNQSSLVQSIVLVNNRDITREPECIVTFTITAASENSDSSPSHNEHYDNFSLHSEGCLLGDDLHEDSPAEVDGDCKSFKSATPKRKSYKMRVPKSEVCVAESHVVKQLPARALGAREPRPWCCKYCGESFIKLVPFANHLKAHLLWVVGRCHVCKECGGSFSSSLQLHRHQQAAHQHLDFQEASEVASDCRVEHEEPVKHEVYSDDEEAVDDPGRRGYKENTKRISALPTKHVEGPHGCQICSKHFHKAQYLLRHLRKHTGDFTCQFCLKVFARKEGLQKHTCPKGSHQKSLKCSLCGRLFLNPDLLEQHYLKHKGNRKCTRCSRMFSSITTLERHMKTCPSVEISKYFKCSICGKHLASGKLLERHMASHKRQYQCDLCNKPYSNSTNLAQHVPLCRQSRQVASVGRVACEDCAKEFTDASVFRAHYLTHTHPFHCSCCNHRFRTRVGYEVHVCDVDQPCDQCSAVFRSVQALNRHFAVHGPPPHTCVSCRRSYYRKESLDRHVCSFEADIKENCKRKESSRFTCSVCGAVLATKHSLNTHLRSAHGGSAARELNCEICGKQFHRKDLLREHQAVHSPASFPCPTCKKLFKTRKSLEVHMLLHLGIKRFACKYCNKKFHQKVNLARHERSHMPRGAVKCQYCGTQCLSTDDLKAHLLSHTLLQPDLSPDVKQQDDPTDFATEKEAFHGENLHRYQKEEPNPNDVDPNLDPECGTEPKLEIIAKTNIEADNESITSQDSVMHPEHSIVKERMEARLNVESETRRIASDKCVQSDSASVSGINGHSTVFMPHKISNICLPSNQSLTGNCLAPNQSETIPLGSAQDICSSDLYPVENNSLNSEVCKLPSNVLLRPAPVSCVGGATHVYNLKANENCNANVVRCPDEQFPQSHRELVNDDAGKDLTLGSCSALVEQVCLYESTSTNVSVTTATTQTLECHGLSNEQIVESVVLMADPPATDC